MLRVGTVMRSKQSILKEINNEYSSELLMLKLKLKDFGHLMQKGNSLKTILMLDLLRLKAKGEEGDRG